MNLIAVSCVSIKAIERWDSAPNSRILGIVWVMLVWFRQWALPLKWNFYLICEHTDIYFCTSSKLISVIQES